MHYTKVLTADDVWCVLCGGKGHDVRNCPWSLRK